MNQPREHPSSEVQHSIALRVLGVPDHEHSGCHCADCSRAQDDLVTLRVLLEERGGELLPDQGRLGSGGPADSIGASPSSPWPRSPRPSGWLLATIAASFLTGALGLVLWMSSLDPVTSSADRWRSETVVGPEVDARLVKGVVSLRWSPTSAATWYRVSIVESSGRLVALRDLEHPCDCRVEVPLAQSGADGPIYFLLEAFDGDWNRAWTRSGRLAVDEQ